MRHPALVYLDQLADGSFDHQRIDLRNAEIAGRAVEPGRVVRGAEYPDAAVGATERLQPVEDRLAVMQHTGRGIQGEWRVGDDARVVPAFARVVVHQEHMVREHLAEAQRLVRRRLAGRG